MIWFTADLHLGHAGILKHNDRKVSCVEEMDATIIDYINDCVGKNDILWHLGDFCWKASMAGHYRQRLKVRQLHCIRGNHDASSLRKHCSTFEMLAIKKFGGRAFTLCHYPMASWVHKEHGAWMLHGHCHNNLDSIPGRQDVGVDAALAILGRMRPFALEELELENPETP